MSDAFGIPEDELLNRKYTDTFTAMLEHYTARILQDRALIAGVAENDNGGLRMTWSALEDFEKF